MEDIKMLNEKVNGLEKQINELEAKQKEIEKLKGEKIRHVVYFDDFEDYAEAFVLNHMIREGQDV